MGVVQPSGEEVAGRTIMAGVMSGGATQAARPIAAAASYLTKRISAPFAHKMRNDVLKQKDLVERALDVDIELTPGAVIESSFLRNLEAFSSVGIFGGGTSTVRGEVKTILGAMDNLSDEFALDFHRRMLEGELVDEQQVGQALFMLLGRLVRHEKRHLLGEHEALFKGKPILNTLQRLKTDYLRDRVLNSADTMGLEVDITAVRKLHPEQVDKILKKTGDGLDPERLRRGPLTGKTVVKKVVPTGMKKFDPATEISLKDARTFDITKTVGDELSIAVDRPFGTYVMSPHEAASFRTELQLLRNKIQRNPEAFLEMDIDIRTAGKIIGATNEAIENSLDVVFAKHTGGQTSLKEASKFGNKLFQHEYNNLTRNSYMKKLMELGAEHDFSKMPTFMVDPQQVGKLKIMKKVLHMDFAESLEFTESFFAREGIVVPGGSFAPKDIKGDRFLNLKRVQDKAARGERELPTGDIEILDHEAGERWLPFYEGIEQGYEREVFDVTGLTKESLDAAKAIGLSDDGIKAWHMIQEGGYGHLWAEAGVANVPASFADTGALDVFPSGEGMLKALTARSQDHLNTLLGGTITGRGGEAFSRIKVLKATASLLQRMQLPETIAAEGRGIGHLGFRLMQFRASMNLASATFGSAKLQLADVMTLGIPWLLGKIFSMPTTSRWLKQGLEYPFTQEGHRMAFANFARIGAVLDKKNEDMETRWRAKAVRLGIPEENVTITKFRGEDFIVPGIQPDVEQQRMLGLTSFPTNPIDIRTR